MSAHVVLMQQIDDVDHYRNGYVPAVQPAPQQHGAELPVGAGGLDAEPAQGDPPNSAVVISFADVDGARGLLNDPDHPPVREIRLSATSRGRAVVALGFTSGEQRSRDA